LAQSSRLIKLANKVLEQLKQRVLCTWIEKKLTIATQKSMQSENLIL
jgi:hypothetical protein